MLQGCVKRVLVAVNCEVQELWSKREMASAGSKKNARSDKVHVSENIETVGGTKDM